MSVVLLTNDIQKSRKLKGKRFTTCCEYGKSQTTQLCPITPQAAKLGPITYHANNLGPITCHGKPLLGFATPSQ